MAPSILLIGAGGAIGTPLVQEFIRQKLSFFRIAILASDASKKAKFAEAEAAGIEVIVGSYLDVSSYKGFDTVISLVGNTLLKLQPAMIDQAIAAGVTQFYPSEYGSDLAQKQFFAHRYFRSKLDTRAHLARRARENPNFKYTLFMNGFFTEYAAYFVDAEKKAVTAYGSPDAPTSLTSVKDITRMVVQSFLLPYTTGQKREIHVSGSRQTFKELMDTLARVQGVSYSYEFRDPAEMLEKQIEAWQQDDEDKEYQWALMTLAATGRAQVGEKLDNELFGFVPETVEETFARLFAK